MQANTPSHPFNTALKVLNTATLVFVCFFLYQLRPLPIDSTGIQDRITNLNIYSELRHNNLSASHDQLKNELESRMAILESRVKLLQGRCQ
jgi:hypothetical protein